MRSGLLAGIRWSVCMLKSHRSLCQSFSRTGAGLCIYHMFVWPNWNFLHISQWITLPTQFCFTFYSFCTAIIIIIILYSLSVFHTSVSWWFLTGVWVTVNLFSQYACVYVYVCACACVFYHSVPAFSLNSSIFQSINLFFLCIWTNIFVNFFLWFSLSLSLSVSLSLSPLSVCLSVCLSLFYTHTHTVTLSLSHTLCLSLHVYALSFSRVHFSALTLSLLHKHTISLSHILSLSHSLTPFLLEPHVSALSLSLSLSLSLLLSLTDSHKCTCYRFLQASHPFSSLLFKILQIWFLSYITISKTALTSYSSIFL